MIAGMTALCLLPAILSLLVLGAHFLRTGSVLVVLVVLAMLPLLALRRRWVSWLVQAVLVLGALEWLRTLIELVGERLAAGEPVQRLVIILGSVTAVTVLSALLFWTPRLRARYGAARPR